ncbi:optic atrophy 3 protein (macronuclear) [Tetrahymena thermophila SB210]|uniref:Optic atrophy 3 protein n=1 Tax=Tetrahymena thermophila (strain SB210) TaxID=312017 RepID=I7LWT1_TETTS|nr:optic atrophy 3 protein [Tetrahymena thermophila SB210]EAS02797.1 optic atrophy 3 protein [Tetrahymena thermophila SB210]|eukprot:XP_001023042.1 optic atrophy 3 protein [Tetrahymena thermophila SB210]
MLPLLKALSLVGKVFSRPIVVIFKVGIQKIGGTPRETLVRWGNIIYNWEAWINRRFLGYEGKVKEVLLSDEKALENFANFFIEVVIVYGVIGYITISQGIQKHREMQEEKERKDRLEEEVYYLNRQKNEIKKELEVLRARWDAQQQMWNSVVQGQNQIFDKHLQTSIENQINIAKLNEKVFQMETILNRIH